MDCPINSYRWLNLTKCLYFPFNNALCVRFEKSTLLFCLNTFLMRNYERSHYFLVINFYCCFLLEGCFCIGVATQDISILHGVKQGFTKIFGVTDVKGQSLPPASPILPVGFQAATNSVTETLEYCTNVRFGFNTQQYYIVATKTFLVQLSGEE